MSQASAGPVECTFHAWIGGKLYRCSLTERPQHLAHDLKLVDSTVKLVEAPGAEAQAVPAEIPANDMPANDMPGNEIPTNEISPTETPAGEEPAAEPA